MALIPKWLLRLAGHGSARERELAEASRDTERRERDHELTEDDVRFRGRSDQVARVPHVVLGVDRNGVPYRIPLRDLTSLPLWATAATGAGKSFRRSST